MACERNDLSVGRGVVSPISCSLRSPLAQRRVCLGQTRRVFPGCFAFFPPTRPFLEEESEGQFPVGNVWRFVWGIVGYRERRVEGRPEDVTRPTGVAVASSGEHCVAPNDAAAKSRRHSHTRSTIPSVQSSFTGGGSCGLRALVVTSTLFLCAWLVSCFLCSSPKWTNQIPKGSDSGARAQMLPAKAGQKRPRHLCVLRVRACCTTALARATRAWRACCVRCAALRMCGVVLLTASCQFGGP